MREWFKALSDTARSFIVGRPPAPPDEHPHQQEFLNQSQQQQPYLQSQYQQQYQQQPQQQYQDVAYTERQYGPPHGQRRHTPSHQPQQLQPRQRTPEEQHNYQQHNQGHQQRIQNQGQQQQASSQHRHPRNNQAYDVRSQVQDARLGFQAPSQQYQFHTPGSSIRPVGPRPESVADHLSHDTVQVAAGHQPVYYIPVPVAQTLPGVLSQSAPQTQSPDQFNEWGALQPVGSFQEQFFLQQQQILPAQSMQQVYFPQQPQQSQPQQAQPQQWQYLPQYPTQQVGSQPSFGQQNFQGLQVPMVSTQPQGSQILNQVRPMVSPLPSRPHSPYVIRHQMTRPPCPGPILGNCQNRMASPRPPLLSLPFLPRDNKSAPSQDHASPLGFVPCTSVPIPRLCTPDLPPTPSRFGIQSLASTCKTTIPTSVATSEGPIRVQAHANQAISSAPFNRKSIEQESTPSAYTKPMLDDPVSKSGPTTSYSQNFPSSPSTPSDDSLLDDGSLREGTEVSNGNPACKSDHLGEGSNWKVSNVGHKKKRRRRKKAPLIPVTIEMINGTNNLSIRPQTQVSRPIGKNVSSDSLDSANAKEYRGSDMKQKKIESQKIEKECHLEDNPKSSPPTPQIKRQGPDPPPPDRMQEIIDITRHAKEPEQQTTAVAKPVYETSASRAKNKSPKVGKRQKLTISTSLEQLPGNKPISLNDKGESGKVVTQLDKETTTPNEISSLTTIFDERVQGYRKEPKVKSVKKGRRKDFKMIEDQDDSTQNTDSALKQTKSVTELDAAVSPKPECVGLSGTSTEQGRTGISTAREVATKNTGGANYVVGVSSASGLATKALEGQLSTIHSRGNIRQNYGSKNGIPGTSDNSVNDRDCGDKPSSDAKAAKICGDDTTAECEVLGIVSVECTQQANDARTVDHQKGSEKVGEISVNGDKKIEKDLASIAKNAKICEVSKKKKRQNTNDNKTKCLSESDINQPDQLKNLPPSSDYETCDDHRSQTLQAQQSSGAISKNKNKPRGFLTPQTSLQGTGSPPSGGNCGDTTTAGREAVVATIAFFPESDGDNAASGICEEQSNSERSAIHVICPEAGSGDVKDSSCSDIDSGGGKTVPRGPPDDAVLLVNVSDCKAPCETHLKKKGSDREDTLSNGTLVESLNSVPDENSILRTSNEVRTSDDVESTKNMYTR